MNILYLLLTILNNLYPAKLDITSELNSSIKIFSNLINQDKSYNLSYLSNLASVSFTLKNITLEKTDNSTMDISIGFKGFIINDSTKTKSSIYLRDIYEFYSLESNFFMDKAYTKIYSFLNPKINLTFGRFPYQISQGLVLSDNSKGLDGIKIDINSFFADIIELFYIKSSNQDSDINTYGFTYNKSFGDGIWQIYSLKINTSLSKEPLQTYLKTDRFYYGGSYSIEKNNIKYSFEFTKQEGNSIIQSSNKKDDDAYALKMNASWYLRLPLIGNSKLKATYLKSTGGQTNTKNKTFFSYLSKRYNGFEYYGEGNIYKVFAWGISKSSNTISGLPQNTSGIKIAGVGIDLPLKKSTLSINYLKYRVSDSTSSNDLGKEYSFSLLSKLSQKTLLELNYSTFSPSLLLKNLKGTKLFFINIKSGF
ncbi:MAG: hypothetical protein N2Z20_03585 [Elusimicrobiales bacterium]|nr:hypothetical protein [Elusimicrobiales bacterium]